MAGRRRRRTPPAAAIVTALRAAEAEHSGRRRDLWGHAAGNAACAMTSESDRDARWLWATALDYTRLAAATEESAAPRSSESMCTTQVTLA